MLGIGPFGQPKLAQDDGPLCEEPVHHRGIAPRRGGAVHNAPGARDFPCLINQILQRQGNAVKTTERLTPGALRIEGGGAGEDTLAIHGDIGRQAFGALDAPKHLPGKGDCREVTAAQRVHRIDQALEMKFRHHASPSPPQEGPDKA